MALTEPDFIAAPPCCLATNVASCCSGISRRSAMLRYQVIASRRNGRRKKPRGNPMIERGVRIVIAAHVASELSSCPLVDVRQAAAIGQEISRGAGAIVGMNVGRLLGNSRLASDNQMLSR